jgi:hypothetical protein
MKKKKLFIVPDGKNIGDETSGDRFVDAVVCQEHIERDYDINENNGMTGVEIESYLNGLDLAQEIDYCWLCAGINLA